MKKESFTHQKQQKKKEKNKPAHMPKKKTNMAALPHYPEFDYESENKAAKWTKYVNRLRNHFTAYNILFTHS